MSKLSLPFRKLFLIRKHSWLVMILLGGALLRFAFLDYGLPRMYLEDESFFVQPALRVARGNLNPQWFGAPGQPIIYAVAAEFRVLNKIVNMVNGTQYAVQKNYAQHVPLFQTAGRVVPALAGTAMIFFAYLLGCFWNRRAGLFAAALVASSFYLMDQSHVIRPDILQTTFLMAMVYSVFRILNTPSQWRWYVWTGVTFGIALAAKFPTLFTIPFFVVFAVVLRKRHQFFLRRWLGTIGTALVATFLSGPYLFLDFHRVLKDLSIENRAEHGGHDGFNAAQNLWWYLSRVLSWEIGTLLYLLTLAVGGYLLYMFFRRHRLTVREEKILLIFVFALLYLVAISVLKLHWFRWIIPVLAFLLIVTAAGLDWLMTRLRHRRFLLSIFFILFFLAPTFRLVRTLYGYGHAYTVEEARQWIIDTVPKNTHFILEPYAPELPPADYQTTMTHNLGWFTPDYYRQLGATYFVIDGRIYSVIMQEYQRLGPDSKYAPAVEGYKKLFAESTPIYEIARPGTMTEDNALYANDFTVLRTLRVDLKKGPYVGIYMLTPISR